MGLNKGEIIAYEDKKYIVLVNLEEDGKKYAFVNELKDEEEITSDYYIFVLKDGNINKIIDENLINRLFPKIQELLKKELEEQIK